MKKESVINAYRDIQPDEAAKARMLQSILSSASEVPLTGKDEITMRKKLKPALIAAVIGLMALLTGCALVALRLQDMKIGEMVILSRGEKRDVISLQGYADSPGMLASKEWFEFVESYDPDCTLLIQAEQSGFQAPAEYDAYDPYTQEMVDKIDEIAEKYGLKLAGERVIVQRWEQELFFEALALENLHQESLAKVYYNYGYFYGCGNFVFNFDMILAEGWKYRVSVSLRYCGKEYFDSVSYTVSDIDSVEQWGYKTADGTKVLLALSDDRVRIFHDREDAFLCTDFDIRYYSEFGEVFTMSKEDMERIADAIDFGIKPQKPDMEMVKRVIAGEEEKYLQAQANQPVQTDEEIYRSYIRERLEAVEHPEELYYTMLDIYGDSTEELLVGSREKLDMIWTVMDDANNGTRHIIFLPPEEVNYDEMAEAWTNMETHPITTYPMD